MIIIKKKPAPSSLLVFEKNLRQSGMLSTDQDYLNAYDNPSMPKGDVLKSLVEEQGFICAYCMRRISHGFGAKGEKNIDDKNLATIEHWAPRKGPNANPQKAIDYSNLLAVCRVSEGCNKSQQTCDVKKGEKRIKYNPSCQADYARMKIFYSFNDAQIHSKDGDFDKNINDVLGLNCSRLMNDRMALLNGIKKALKKKKPNELITQWPIDVLQSRTLKAFCGIVNAYLLKKIQINYSSR